MPKVSVITPTYNRASTLPRTIESVQKQTLQDYEHIIVDDGSTDDTEDVVDSIDDGRIRYLSLGENRGANVARNAGIARSKGEFVAFLDSDDEWDPEKIERQANALERSDAKAAYTSVNQVNSNGDLNGIRRAAHSGDLRPHLLTGNEIGTFSSVMVAADAIRNIGYPNPNLPCWQDWEWYLCLSESIEFVALKDPLVRRHNGGDQISRSFAPKRDRAYPTLKKRLQSVVRTDEERGTALAHLDFELGYAALCNHKYQTARSHFLSAIRRRPRVPQFYKFLAVSGPHYPQARHLKRILTRGVQS